MPERWILAGLLLVGFLWLRSKARKSRTEHLGSKAFLAFGILAPVLLALGWVAENPLFGRTVDFLLQIALLAAAFAASGALLRPPRAPPENSRE
jgi:hypothetical protein